MSVATIRAAILAGWMTDPAGRLSPGGTLPVNTLNQLDNLAHYIAVELDALAVGGGTDHALLSNRVWTASGHTSGIAAARVAAFDATQAAVLLQVGVDLQAYDADLAAYAALATTGLVVRTGSGTVAARTITASGGITVANGSGVSGNPSLTTTGLLEDLNTLGPPASDGQIAVATGAGTLAWESGATLRTSIGVGTGDNVQFSDVGAGVSPSWRLDVEDSPGSGGVVAKIKNATAYALERGLWIYLTGNPTGTGDLFQFFEDPGGQRGSISGDGGTGVNYNDTSDERLKKNIRPAVWTTPNGAQTTAREIARRVQPIDYEPIAPGPKARTVRGFSAQELHAVYPQAVTPGYTEMRPVYEEHVVTRGDKRTVTRVQVGEQAVEIPWQIATNKLLPLLFATIKEQDAALVALEARLAALESR